MRRTRQPILAAVGLRKRFGALVVLDGVDFALAAGEAVGIVGPNGAGKTTLLNVLAGALRPTPGRVALPRRRRHARGAPPPLPARDRAHAPGAAAVRRHDRVRERARRRDAPARGRRGAAPTTRCIDVLEQCGLADVANRRAESLGLLAPQAPRARARARHRPGGAAARRDRRRADRRRGRRARRDDRASCARAASRSSGSSTSSTCSCRWSSRLVCMDAGRVIADGEPEAGDGATPRVIDAYLGGGRDERCSRSRRSTRGTACCRRCAASRFDVARGRDASRWSAPTAPARRRCCARSPARTGPRPAGSCFDGADITRDAGPPARRASASRWCRRAAGCSRPDRRGEPARRGARRPAGRGTSSAVLEAFPLLRAAAPAGGRRPLGRRAAGDRDRPRADDATRACCCSTRSRSGWRRSPSTRSTARSHDADRGGADDRARRAGPRRARSRSPTASSACSRAASCSRARRAS